MNLLNKDRPELGAISEPDSQWLAIENRLSELERQMAMIQVIARPEVSEKTAVEIDSQDRNTILAALRLYQSEGYGCPTQRPNWLHDIATNYDCETSLDDSGINDLCERINVDCNSYESRVRAYEAQGMTRSDAQAVVDAEDLR